MLKSNFWLIVTVTGIAAWHLLTIRAGHDWGDAFSLYIQHAKNIVEGRPYADTGYLYNPSLPVLSPGLPRECGAVAAIRRTPQRPAA